MQRRLQRRVQLWRGDGEGQSAEGGVWGGLTTFFRSRETVKSSPEIEKQVTSESASVWGQNLEFSGVNWPKKHKKEQSHVCVIAHIASCASGAADFNVSHSNCPDEEVVAHSAAQNQQLPLECTEVKPSPSWSHPCEPLTSS